MVNLGVITIAGACVCRGRIWGTTNSLSVGAYGEVAIASGGVILGGLWTTPGRYQRLDQVRIAAVTVSLAGSTCRLFIFQGESQFRHECWLGLPLAAQLLLAHLCIIDSLIVHILGRLAAGRDQGLCARYATIENLTRRPLVFPIRSCEGVPLSIADIDCDKLL